MRFLVVLCVIAALAAPSLVKAEDEAPAITEAATTAAPEPAPDATAQPVAVQPAEYDPSAVPVPDASITIAEPQVDPTPAPGEEPVVVQVTRPERPSLSNFFHSIYDGFGLPNFHLPSLWPFRRGYPLRDGFYPRGRYPPGPPPVFIVRENEPMNDDYY